MTFPFTEGHQLCPPQDSFSKLSDLGGLQFLLSVGDHVRTWFRRQKTQTSSTQKNYWPKHKILLIGKITAMLSLLCLGGLFKTLAINTFQISKRVEQSQDSPLSPCSSFNNYKSFANLVWSIAFTPLFVALDFCQRTLWKGLSFHLVTTSFNMIL